MNTRPEMNTVLREIVNHRAQDSLATSFRRKRFEIFHVLVDSLKCPVTILDLGGEEVFWELMGLGNDPDYQIEILNLYPVETTLSNVRAVTGDATDLKDYADGQFDVVFSNSVIEHVYTFEAQQRMASEARRAGKRYYVQTPNKYFPLEPHFLVPFFQFFPTGLQISLLQRFDLGWYKKIPDREQASDLVRSHRLLTEREFQSLFPDGRLYREKVFGMTKSMIAYGPAAVLQD